MRTRRLPGFPSLSLSGPVCQTKPRFAANSACRQRALWSWSLAAAAASAAWIQSAPRCDTVALENIAASQSNSSQILGGVATIERGVSPAVVSHYAVQPVIDIYATNAGRDLGAVSRDIREILAANAKDAPPGATVVLRGQTATMTAAYTQLLAGWRWRSY